MDSCAKPPETPSNLIFSQVVFIDIPHSYPPAAPLTCCYTVTAAFQPSNKDWVGIFRVRQQVLRPLWRADLLSGERSNHLPLQVGWSKTRDYHTFVWVDSNQDGTGHQSEIRQAVFNGNKSHLSCRVDVCTIHHNENSVRLMLTLGAAMTGSGF